MLSLRKFDLFIAIVIALLAMSSFAVAQDATARKDIEALYAKRDKAIKDKDVAAFRSTIAKDFLTSGSENAAQSESIFKQAKDVKSFVTHIESMKPCPSSVPEQVDAHCEENEIIVTVREYGKMTFDIMSDGALDKGTWVSRLDHVLLRTDGGWKIKYEESNGGFYGEKDGETRGEEVTDNQVWQEIKALYATRDKARRVRTSIMAISQGKDKDEVVVDIGEDVVGVSASLLTDTWIRTGTTWKMKQPR